MAGLRYADALDAAWEAHLAPRAADAPTVVSTFAGIGGSSLGYSMAGYRELLAVEWGDRPVATFRANFPDVPVHHGDIAALSVDDALRITGLKPGELDVFDGSPPCQGFSMAGRRVMDDPRNRLFQEFVRLLRGFAPRAFVMENVSGMVSGRMRLIFVDILRELRAAGYRVSASVLDAAYFGVPQHRRRIIFVGVREDLDREPSHPLAQNRLFGPPREVDASERWLTQREQDGARAHRARHRAKGNGFGFQVLTERKPAPTWPRTQIIQTSPLWLEQGDRLRAPSMAELHWIGSFPTRFVFTGGYDAAWAGIGNCVPPLFMRAIAEHVRGILETPRG